ncbi:hypothetical protein AB0J83_24290 [Actinoplanes sp. NPDC049596]|uniref:hypothetical protein n=1 Tax=unclassified Actinoplanes TaxID=2626549 RepID=UPI00343DF5D1
MTNAVPFQALQLLLRGARHPEVKTNYVLQGLLDADPRMTRSFLAALSSLSGVDVTGCRIERESAEDDSRRDFRLSRPGGTRAIIETKVDSALTSGDQAARYLSQLPADGLFVLVTREPLVRALAVQAGHQIGVHLPDGSYRGTAGDRVVLVVSWARLLESVVAEDGRPYPELLALSAAVEGVTDFVPFTAAVEDVAVGRLVEQVSDVARRVCRGLPDALAAAGARVDAIEKVKDNGKAVWRTVVVLGHRFWVGYSATSWKVTPGDPDLPTSGPAGPPSPFWVNRHTSTPPPAQRDREDERRQRLDALGIARPLPVPLGLPREAVVTSLLTQAATHIRQISDALHADPAAVASNPTPASPPGSWDDLNASTVDEDDDSGV